MIVYAYLFEYYAIKVPKTRASHKDCLDEPIVPQCPENRTWSENKLRGWRRISKYKLW